MNADGVGCVVQDATGAAHSDGISLASASTAIYWSGFNAAVCLLISTAVNFDKAGLYP